MIFHSKPTIWGSPKSFLLSPILGRGPGAVQAESNTKTKIRAKQSPLSAPTSALGDFASDVCKFGGILLAKKKSRHDHHGTSMIIQSGKLISRNLEVSNVEKLSLSNVPTNSQVEDAMTRTGRQGLVAKGREVVQERAVE